MNLRNKIEEIEKKSGAQSLAVAVYDCESGKDFHYRGERWFHAASTIKIPILLGVFAAIHKGELHGKARVHVRNLFRSVADGSPYKVQPERDANAAVYNAIGKLMQVNDLSHHMITTSSNLATNLLLDLVGLHHIQQVLEELHLAEGIELRRGVEDELAFDKGINNRVTADGLTKLLRVAAEEKMFSPGLSREMLEVMHAQEFNSGIPAGVPSKARVAHKTGEISTIAHDAGIVYVDNRKPYVITVLTEWDPDTSGRMETIANVSNVVYQEMIKNA